MFTTKPHETCGASSPNKLGISLRKRLGAPDADDIFRVLYRKYSVHEHLDRLYDIFTMALIEVLTSELHSPANESVG